MVALLRLLHQAPQGALPIAARQQLQAARVQRRRQPPRQLYEPRHLLSGHGPQLRQSLGPPGGRVGRAGRHLRRQAAAGVVEHGVEVEAAAVAVDVLREVAHLEPTTTSRGMTKRHVEELFPVPFPFKTLLKTGIPTPFPFQTTLSNRPKATPRSSCPPL